MPARWQRLGAFDLILCDNYHGTNSPVITAVFRITGRVTSHFVERYIATPLGTHPRFRSIVNEARARFELQHHFDPGAHVTLHDEQLTTPVLDKVLSTPLDVNKPGWSLDVFCQPDGAYTDIVLRIDHVIGDGVGLVTYVLSVIATEVKHNDAPPAVEMQPRRKLNASLVEAGAEPTCWDAITRPFRDCAATFVTALIPDACNAFTRATLGTCKLCAWARTRSVIALRNSARQIGVTLNDLLICALCGALRRYMQRQGDTNSRLNVAIPVNGHSVTRQASTNTDFVHNALIVLPLALRLDEQDRLRRLARITHSMRDMKRGYRVPFSLIAFGLLANMPRPIRVWLWRHITKKVTLTLSNVAGPSKRLVLGTLPVESLRVLAPSHGSSGVAFTAFSYVDELRVGLSANATRVEKPQLLMELFDDELDATVTWINGLTVKQT